MFGSEGNVCLKKDKVGKGNNRKSPNPERKSNLYIDIEMKWVYFVETEHFPGHLSKIILKCIQILLSDIKKTRKFILRAQSRLHHMTFFRLWPIHR